MISAHARRAGSLFYAVLLVLFAVLSLGASSAVAAPPRSSTAISRAHVPAGTATARITRAPILGTSRQDVARPRPPRRPSPRRTGR